MGEEGDFHWADYLIFVASLVLTLDVGMYFAYTGRKKKTTDEFLLGSRNMHWIPVSLSLTVSYVSAITILGLTAESHYFGSMSSVLGLGFLLGGILVIAVYIPVLHRMKVTSCHEYFELRFGSRLVRTAVSLTFLAMMILYLALLLYAPALAFSEVTDVSMEFSILTCALVCTIYTAAGGVKAVVAVDTIQVFVIVAGLIVLIVAGVYHEDVGGPSVVYDRLKETPRLDLDSWDLDPRVRLTWWGVIGTAVTVCSMYATSQMAVQRYLSLPKKLDAQKTMALSVASNIIVWCVLLGTLGCVTYAYYYKCDPLVVGKISKPDQLLPRFLMDILGDVHGLPGLFTAAIFAAALSSVSSVLNSMAAVTLEDYIKPMYKMRRGRELSSVSGLWISRAFAVVFGLVCAGMSFAADHFGDSLASMIISVASMFATPIFGCFTLSMLVGWITSMGCFLGLVSGVGVSLWVSYGRIEHGQVSGRMPIGFACFLSPSAVLPTTFTEGFDGMTPYEMTSVVENMTSFTPPPKSFDTDHRFQELYDVSYIWSGPISFVAVTVVGVLVSSVEQIFRKRTLCEASAEAEPTLMYDIGSNCCCCLSPGSRSKIQCGVPFETMDVEDEKKIHSNGNTIHTGVRVETSGLANPVFCTRL